MKILQIILNKYTRLELNHIKELVYTPVEREQIIIGTNGSGKSSLLYELSPLPANHKNYASGGFKKIKIEHRGSIYELSSSFDKGQSHSFVKDGVELNPGVGTYSTQLDLVQTHFGINQKFHELFLGIKRFTRMSVAERREWFTQLSDANYDYAISVYNRVKERARDVSGSIKIGKKKLSFETNKIFDEAELKALESKCQTLYDLVAVLQENRIPAEYDSQALEQEGAQLLKQIDSKGKLLSNLRQAIAPYLHEIPTLQESIASLQQELAQCKALSDQYYKDFEKTSEQFEIAKKVKQASIEELRQSIAAIEQEIDAIRAKYTLGLPEVTSPGEVRAQLDSVDHWIVKVLPVLIESKGKGYTLARKVELSTSLQTQRDAAAFLAQDIRKASGIIEHLNALKSDKQVECPNCNHRWIVGFDQCLFDRSKERLAFYETENQRLLKSISETSEELQILEQYLSAVDSVYGAFKANELLQDFLGYVLQKEIIHKDPANLQYQMDIYRKDLSDQERVYECIRVIKHKNELISKAIENKDLDYDFIEKHKKDLELQMAELTDRQRSASMQLKSAKSLLEDVTLLTSDSDELEQLLANYHALGENSIETFRRNLYNEMLRNVQSILAKHEAQLHEARNHRNIIKAIEEQISDLENEERLLKIVAKELSPTEGLIAEGLFGFMQLFVSQMNAFIKKIWTYPLVIMPCALGDDGSLDLDYKFPMVVDTSDRSRKDVSEGSSAMHEVVDLAFKITAMKALRLQDYPLFLDEFGSTMDPTHKAATIELINSIMKQDHFTQLFMISHDVVQYGALSNTEVSVLSATNMMLPKDSVYNRNMLINNN